MQLFLLILGDQMATLPKLQVLWRRGVDNDRETLFGWIVQPISEINSFKIYQSESSKGPFYLFKDNIPNRISNSMYGQFVDKVNYCIKDIEIPIDENKIHYFKLTYVTPLGAESTLADSPITIVYPPGVQNDTQVDNTHIYGYGFGWSPLENKWKKEKTGLDNYTLFDTRLINSDGDIYSNPIDIESFSKISLYVEITKNNVPTSISISLEFSPGISQEFIQYKDTSGSGNHFDESVDSGKFTITNTSKYILFPDSEKVTGKFVRIKLTSTGCSAVNTFIATINAAIQY
jgi:hypothetical protein